MKLWLLPGMDGTGDLFVPLLSALGDDANDARVVRYGSASARYDVLLDEIGAPSEPTVVVAESFGGPLAIRLASRSANVRALVLVATFVRGPRLARWLAPFAALAPARPPAFAARALMLGGEDPSALLDAIASVPASTLRARIREIATVDVRRELASLTIPIVWAVATRDRLIGTARPIGGRVIEIEGPHLLAQTRAVAIADVIRETLGR